MTMMLTMKLVRMMMHCGCTIVNMVSGDDDDDVDDGVDDEAGENDDVLRLHDRQHGEWGRWYNGDDDEDDKDNDDDV